MAVGSITAGGIMSGLDADSLISQMMAIERRPIQLLQQREASYQAQVSGIGNLKSALSQLQSAVEALEDENAFTVYTASSSNKDILSTSASDTTTPASYQIEVPQLAQAQQVRSAAFSGSDATVGTGTLILQVGAEEGVEIAIGAENNTLAEIATAINEAGAGVTAGVVDDGNGNAYLTLLSQETGEDNTITLTVSDDDGNNDDASGLSGLYTDPAVHTLTETQAALNAQLTVNGIAVERSGNTIDDLLEGVTLTLNQEDPGNPVTVDVAKSNTSAVKKVQAFVDQYNSMVETLNKLQSYNSETEQSGLLLGDSTTRMIESRMRSFLSYQVEGVDDTVNGLSRLGIEVDRNGKLRLDSDALTTALEDHYDDVVNFFTQDEEGSEGLAVQLYDTLDNYVKSTGVLASKEDGLQASIDDVQDQIDAMGRRLEQREENLRSKFQALESLLAEYQTTETMLNQQINSLNNLSKAISNK
jgi:flagellar hook-associated protein 2